MGTVLEFCQNMDIPIEVFSVRVTGKRESNPSRISNFKASLHIEGDVPENRLETILRVAKGCRIHNTLSQSPKIEVDLAVNEANSTKSK